MWKKLYEKVKQQQKENLAATGPNDARPRLLLDDFFDNLGALVQRHAEERRLGFGVDQGDGSGDGGGAGSGGAEPAASGAQRASLPVPDAEDSQAAPEDKARLLSDALGSNIEVLYVNVLHTILHTVGYSENGENDRTSLFTYLQAAFNFDDEKHNKLMEQARIKEAPNILLHVEVIEAKDIKPMDVNGLSDTFCTVFLTSSDHQKYHTTVKLATLCPEWKEHFCLPVQNTPEESLCIEAWDFDPAETVQEKVMKIGVVKGIRGWGKFAREFGSTGKNENEFIGSSVLSLNSINASGETRWCDLEKKGKKDKRGRVKVSLAFSTQMSKEAVFKDHRNLLRLLLLYELESTEVEPYCWKGKLVNFAETILTQHLLQSGLSPIIDPLIKWVEYCNVHVDHPLSFEVFSALMEELLPPLQNKMFDREKELLFWEAAKSLIPSCFNGIKQLHILTPNEKNTLQMATLLRVLSYLRCIELPEGFELFPSSLYRWLLPLEDSNTCDVATVTKRAIVKGTEDWYNNIIENNIIDNSDVSGEVRLNHLIMIIKNALDDLHIATKVYDKIFQETLQLAYAMTLYSAHGYKISELVEPVIEEVYQILKPLKFVDESSTEVNEDDVLAYGMQLFDLYLTLQRFVVSGSGLNYDGQEKPKLSEYHLWFHRSVAQWLDIALWKALKRIKKAVELDDLVPASDSVKHSSSAIDTLGIFHQIKVFWKELAWPDVEGSYVFVAKIVDDICHCSVYYADLMSQRIEKLSSSENKSNKFEVSKECCLAINNIEFIWHSIEPFVQELGMNNVIIELAQIKSTADTEQCRRTLQLVIDNTVETVGTKISELLDRLTIKMIPVIHTFLLEGTEMLHKGDEHIDKLMLYLEKNLMILNSELNSEIFQEILLIIWDVVARILFNLVEKSLEEKRPPPYFSNLQKALDILLNFFKGGDKEGQIFEAKSLKDVQKILALHSMDTVQLIFKFYLERIEEQKSLEVASLGVITILAEFVENFLRIEVLNGRKLRPMDSNGSCDPYVEIALLPAEKFLGIPKQKTKTQKKTLFPLFDESFSFDLSWDQRKEKDGMVLFSVKDKDMLGNELVGEAFICFSEIEKEGKTESGHLQQINLNLTLPKNLDSQVSKTLQIRQGDKVAKEFIKKQKAKAAAH